MAIHSSQKHGAAETVITIGLWGIWEGQIYLRIIDPGIFKCGLAQSPWSLQGNKVTKTQKVRGRVRNWKNYTEDRNVNERIKFNETFLRL